MQRLSKGGLNLCSVDKYGLLHIMCQKHGPYHVHHSTYQNNKRERKLAAPLGNHA